MGWNDRLFEDPYWPEQNNDDRDSYENWCAYIESQLDEAEANAGISSQNISKDDIRRLTAIVDEGNEKETNDNSRQPAHNQEECDSRPTGTPADCQDV